MVNRLLCVTLMLFLLGCESTLMKEYNLAVEERNHSSAIQSVERALTANPGEPEANFLMGKILMEQRNYAEAKPYFERSLEVSPLFRERIEYLIEMSYRTEFNQAVSAWEDQDYELSARLLHKALEAKPEAVEVYPVLGQAYMNMEQYASAEAAFRECVPVDRFRRLCSTNLAVSLFRDNRFEEANRVAKENMSYLPYDRNLVKIVAYSYLEMQEFDEAEDFFSRYMRFGFTYDALKQFATELNNSGELVRAEEYLVLCLQYDPHDKEVLEVLSTIYLETGNYDLMVQANERLLALNPESIVFRQRLALANELASDRNRNGDMPSNP